MADGDLWTSLNSDTQDDAYKSTWGTTNVFPVNVDSELSFSSSEFDNTRESKQAQLPLHVKGSSKISMVYLFFTCTLYFCYFCMLED